MILPETAGCSLCGLNWGNCQCATRPKSATGSRPLDSVVSRQDRPSVEQFIEFFERYGDFNLQAIVDHNEAHFSLEDLYQAFKSRLFTDIGFERGRGDQEF